MQKGGKVGRKPRMFAKFMQSGCSAVATLLLGCAILCCNVAPAHAKPSQTADFPAAPLSDTLHAISARYGVSIGADGALPAIVTRPVHNARSVAEALAQMLVHSGYVARQVGTDAWRIEAGRIEVAPMVRAVACSATIRVRGWRQSG